MRFYHQLLFCLGLFATPLYVHSAAVGGAPLAELAASDPRMPHTPSMVVSKPLFAGVNVEEETGSLVTLEQTESAALGVDSGYKTAFLAAVAADKAVYESIQKYVRRLHGATRSNWSEDEINAYANSLFEHFRLNPEHPRNALYSAQHAIKMAEAKNRLSPGIINSLVLLAQRKVLQPVSVFNAEHSTEINAVARMLMIASAAAFVFNKVGGTEYIRAKIKEAFAKPTIYTIQQRKKGWFGKDPVGLIGIDDLILAPKTEKQVKELIWLTRRRYEELKATQKAPPPFDHVLLYGPPGTGKTSIAQMIADQSLGDDGNPMKIIRLMASDFMQINKEGDRIGVLKEMFHVARKMGNCIIFLDEIDGMVAQRGKENESSNRAFLDHLLDEMATPSTKYFVIAATNHIEKVDKALLSRFRRKMMVGLPTELQRKKILDKKINQDLIQRGYTSTINTQELAALLVGDAGRDLEAFVSRIRDRLDYERGSVANQEIAYTVLREMGKLPATDEDNESLEPASEA